MAEIGLWLRAWGGPKDGGSIYFPAGQEHLPVSCADKSDPCSMYRVGSSLHDWTGILTGHYYKDGGRASFLDMPRAVKGFYTNYQEPDDQC